VLDEGPLSTAFESSNRPCAETNSTDRCRVAAVLGLLSWRRAPRILASSREVKRGETAPLPDSQPPFPARSPGRFARRKQAMQGQLASRLPSGLVENQ
jgi:hypothetical protein